MRVHLRALLLFLSLLARIAVPSGYMVAPASAALSFVECPEVIDAAPAHHKQRGHDHGGAQHGGPCAFAGLSAPAVASAALAVAPAPAPVTVATEPVTPQRRALPPPAAPPPPSRAPPALS